MTSRSLCWLSAVSLLLAGCAAIPSAVPVGASMPEVESLLGRPRDVLAAPDGTLEWQYPTGPYGQNTYIVTFDSDQRVSAFRQALTFDNFAKIRRDMTRDEIRLMFGRPYTTVFYRNLDEEVWSYRYLIPVNDNRIFNVHFDAKTGYVRSTSDQIDPLLNPTNHDSTSNT